MDILNLARELGVAIQQNEEYIDYRINEQKIECDKNLQSMIEKFNLKKVDINLEISKEDSDKEKLDKLNKEIGELYSEITNNETMKNFNESKQKFENLLNKVNYIITESARGSDPFMVNPDEQESCAGNCSSCSGCS